MVGFAAAHDGERHLRDARKSERPRCRWRDIDHPPTNEGSAVVDANNGSVSVAVIRHLDYCAERQCRMRGRHGVRSQGLATRGLRARRATVNGRKARQMRRPVCTLRQRSPARITRNRRDSRHREANASHPGRSHRHTLGSSPTRHHNPMSLAGFPHHATKSGLPPRRSRHRRARTRHCARGRTWIYGPARMALPAGSSPRVAAPTRGASKT